MQDEPLNFALIENGVVVNTIWLQASNRLDFPNSVCITNKPVAVGDLYANGEFTRDGVVVPDYRETLIETIEALNRLEEALNG